MIFMSSYAQEILKYNNIGDKHGKCMVDPGMPANAKLAWPKSDYTPLQDSACPPCYTYTSNFGTPIMECPFLTFAPEKKEGGVVAADATANPPALEEVRAKQQNAYSGYYPKVCKRDPHMPANAKPSWPESPYVSLVGPQCAPCYTYTNKHGLEIMECPGLIFLPEKK